MLRDADQVWDDLRALRALGVRIAIDDFGTGYSSLSYLRQMPVDVLKIDKSFIDDILASEQQRALVDAIVTLARNLDLAVVAEGIEEPGQRGRLAGWAARTARATCSPSRSGRTRSRASPARSPSWCKHRPGVCRVIHWRSWTAVGQGRGVLENPVWAALTGPQACFAEVAGDGRLFLVRRLPVRARWPTPPTRPAGATWPR